MSAAIRPRTAAPWQYLAPNPKSAYKQLFLKDTRIRAEVVYGLTVDGSEPLTVEEAAAEYGLPLEAVREAIAYCQSNPPEIAQDHAAEEALMQATGMNSGNYCGSPRVLSAEEAARLRRL